MTPRRRLILAGGAAAVALAAAVVAAAGPARAHSSEYAWPPPTLPDASPQQGWYAPLPLLNRVPSSIEVEVPCGLAPPLAGDGPVTVIATARRPEPARALRVTLEGQSLRVRVGHDLVGGAPWPDSCPLRIAVTERELRLGGRTSVLDIGTPEDMPVVTGLFSGLDLRAGEPPQTLLRTRAYASSWTPRQMLAGAVAVLFVCLTLILLARPGRLRLGGVAGRLRAGWKARDATDVVVVAGLLVWWLVAPTFTDDGWFRAIDHVFGDLGTASLLYDNWGLNQPLGYWLEWLRHWTIGSTDHLLVMRLPALVVLLATWLVCRRCLLMLVPDALPHGVRWVLAGAFLVGAMSWGMTLRLEPFVALLAVVCLVTMVSFVREPRLAPLALAIPTVVLAGTAHPAGLVAASPILAATPALVRWLSARWLERVLAVVALLGAGLALALVAYTLDADLQTRLADARLLREGEYFHEPWREYLRYLDFDQNGAETAARRLSLALLLLSALAWLTRRSRVRRDPMSLPACSVLIGLVLLAFVPSKWPWHFGALIGIGAVAVAVEVTRLMSESERSRVWPIRSTVALLLLGVAASYAWNANGEWSQLDLQNVSWDEGFGVEYQTSAALLLVAAAFLIVVWRARGIRRRVLRPELISRVTTVLLFAVVGVTTAVLVHDAAVSAWTPARQNLDALAGGGNCGLAHQVRSEGDIVQLLSDPGVRTLLAPSVGTYFPCATLPSVRGGVIEIPRLVAFESDPWPLTEHDGPFAAVADLYGMRQIATGARDLEVRAVDGHIPQFVRVDAVRRN